MEDCLTIMEQTFNLNGMYKKLIFIFQYFIQICKLLLDEY